MENLALQRTVTKLANDEIKRHNLVGWRFRLNTNKTRLGVCRYDRKTIEISVHVLPLGLKRAVQVVAHELAHAIVGHGHGHDSVWRAKAIELGDTGERCGVMHVEKSVVGTCPHCDFTVKRHRRVRGACPKCRHLPVHERMIEWERV